MKRLLLIASVAILAAGCQKTFVDNEVQTPIGFSTEVGKQTRAIVSGNAYFINQPFAVYAYGHQVFTDASGNSTDTPNQVAVMDNVEISCTPGDANANPATSDKWAASGTTKYYWPNDPRTHINFYAYSPAQSATDYAKHQELTGTVSHSETAGFTLTDYVHSNMYVDFMVGRPVIAATYGDQDGTNGQVANLKSVPVSFNHQMTQVVFNVRTSEAYSGVTFTVNRITLNNIGSKATYTHTSLTPSYADTESKFTSGSWSTTTLPISYTIFPATTNGDNAAPELVNSAANNVESAFVVDNTEAKTLKTTPVTMIPQTLKASAPAVDETPAVYGQSFTIEYTIAGTGVAEETVVKTLDFVDASVNWTVNKKIIYTVTIGLNEITFAPEVVSWADGSFEYEFEQ